MNIILPNMSNYTKDQGDVCQKTTVIYWYVNDGSNKNTGIGARYNIQEKVKYYGEEIKYQNLQWG